MGSTSEGSGRTEQHQQHPTGYKIATAPPATLPPAGGVHLTLHCTCWGLSLGCFTLGMQCPDDSTSCLVPRCIWDLWASLGASLQLSWEPGMWGSATAAAELHQFSRGRRGRIWQISKLTKSSECPVALLYQAQAKAISISWRHSV